MNSVRCGALGRFLMRRALLMAISLVGITLLTFFVLRLAPGDPVSLATGIGADRADELGVSDLERGTARAKRELLGTLATHVYRVSAEDPDGERVRVEVDWGDGEQLENTALLAAAEAAAGLDLEHSWPAPGEYRVRVRAIDERGSVSPWSEPLVVRARQGEELPASPGRPAGPAWVEVGAKVEYAFELEGGARLDPAAGAVLVVDRGSRAGAVVARVTGESWKRVLSWTTPGVREVRARIIAADGARSSWSEPLVVGVHRRGESLVPPTPPAGPEFGVVGDVLTYVSRAVTPPGDGATPPRLRLSVEPTWGDPGATRLIDPDAGPLEGVASFSLQLDQPGDYSLSVTALGADGEESPSSKPPLEVHVDAANHPPLAPAPPSGPTDARVETTLFEQYLTWVGRLVRLDFGESYRYRCDVWTLIWDERLPRTLILSALSLLVSYLLGIPLGVFAAARPRSLASKSSTVVLFVLFALPSFWVATMLLVLVTDWPVVPLDHLSCENPGVHDIGPGGRFVAMGVAFAVALALAIRRLVASRGTATALAWTAGLAVAAAALAVVLGWAPRSDLNAGILATLAALAVGTGAVFTARRRRHSSPSGAFASLAVATAVLLAGLWWAITTDLFWHALLPVICLSYGNLAVISRYARSGMIEVLQQDYIRTARAKGLSERAVVLRHGLRGGMIPVLTLIGTVLPALITGSVIVEYVFTIEGTGLLVIQAIQGRDYNVVLAMTTLAAVLTLVGYLVSDILYALADPRVGFGRRGAEG